MNLKNYLCVSFCLAFVMLFAAGAADAQQTRSRIVTTGSSRPTNPTAASQINRTVLSSPTTAAPTATVTANLNSRPVLTNQILVPPPAPVKKIVSAQPTNAAAPKLADASKPTLAERYLYGATRIWLVRTGRELRFELTVTVGAVVVGEERTVRLSWLAAVGLVGRLEPVVTMRERVC